MLHTWPETGTVNIDIFSCSTRLKSLAAIAELGRSFGAADVSVQEIPRADGHGARPDRRRVTSCCGAWPGASASSACSVCPGSKRTCVLPFTRAQGGLAARLFGAPALPIEVTLACSGADALALCLRRDPRLSGALARRAWPARPAARR